MRLEPSLILLVDDESQIRKLCLQVLARQGYRVVEADNGTDAIAVAARQEGHIDLLLTDVLMPGMNGPELAQAIATTRPETSVLLMSGGDPEVLRKWLGGGDSVVLRKPFLPATLLQRVAEVLNRAATQELARRKVPDSRREQIGQEQIEGELRAAMKQAYQGLLDASQFYNAKLEEFNLSEKPAPNGAEVVCNAGKARGAALQKYQRALRTFTDFVSNKRAMKASQSLEDQTEHVTKKMTA